MPARFAGMKLVGDWKEAKAVLAGAPAEMKNAVEASLHALAEFFAGEVKKKIGSNVPPPNSPLTVLMKRSSKTLINKGDMRNAVRAVQGASKLEWWVGIPSKAVGGKGGSLARVAEIQERGATIVTRMTDRQRKFLHAVLGQRGASRVSGSAVGTGILVIHIPPRPFIQPVFESYKSSAGRVFEGYLQKNLKRLAK